MGGEHPLKEGAHTTTRREWFIRGLGSRTRNLRGSLAALKAGRKSADRELREQARFLFETSIHYGSAGIADNALVTVNSSDGRLVASAQGLLTALADAQDESLAQKPVVLVIGGESSFVEGLRKAIEPDACEIVYAADPDDAASVVQDGRVEVVVTHVTPGAFTTDSASSRFPDAVGATVTTTLYVGEWTRDRRKLQAILQGEDNYLEGIPDAKNAAAWVMNRLRRAHRGNRTEWHDRATGLQGRETFLACYPKVAETCAQSDEPFSLALLRPDGATPSTMGRIGRLLAENLRSSDLIARWDHSTFAILFPGEDQFGAACAVEKIRASARDESTLDGGQTDSVTTLLAGISLAAPDEPVEGVVSEAEKYLERAQTTDQGGVAFSRNRLVSRKSAALIVSADPLVTRVLCGMLAADAFRTTVSTDMRHAVHCCTGRRRYQLIVLDESIKPSGLEVLKALKSAERNLRVPAVVLRSHDSIVREADYHSMGAAECFARPLNATDILERVKCLVWEYSAFSDPYRRSYHLLVIADDPGWLYLCSALLNAHGGFHLYLAKGAEDGCERLGEDLYDGILVSQKMVARGAHGGLRVCGHEVADGEVSVIIAVDQGACLDPALAEACDVVLKLPVEVSSFAASFEKMLGLPENRPLDPCPSDWIRREVQRVSDLNHPERNSQPPVRPSASGKELAHKSVRSSEKPRRGRARRAGTNGRPVMAGRSGRSRRATARGTGTAPPPLSGEAAVIDLGGGVTMEFVPVGPGEAVIGSPSTEQGREDDEQERIVVLEKQLWIGRFPVTQEQWQVLLGSNPSVFRGARNPVECVSWADAQAFCRALSAFAGIPVRLPSEDEWEFACRGDSGSSYCADSGEDHLDQVGWYDGNSGGMPRPVGQKAPNRFHIYDMHGNVWEWCQDRFDRMIENEPAGANPPDSDTLRVFRGGCWCSNHVLCRSAYRGCGNPLLGNHGMGLRVVTESPGAPMPS
jgi:formylglycine-generating enzyme required for sulfatase activity/PleD family two-component response regulator